MNNAMGRYLQLISPPSGSQGALKQCTISVAKNSAVPIIGADESYQLDVISDGTCNISAQTWWGALRGLESFTHFLVRNTNSVDTVSSAISITDAPRFGHRGMLIDTARHYLSIASIQQVIDALPISK